MLELRLTQGNRIKELLSIISSMADIAMVDCSSNALTLQAKDRFYPGNCLVLHLRSNFFDHFLCDQNISSGIKLDEMERILSRAKNGDTVTIKGCNGSGTISFIIERLSKEKLSDEMKLLDKENEYLNIHQGAYEVIVEMTSLYFADLCAILANPEYSNTAIISVANKRVKFSSEVDIDKGSSETNKRVKFSNEVDNDKGSLDTSCQKNITNIDVPEDLATVKTDVTDPVSFSFGLQRMLYITRMSYISNTVEISMSSGLPVALEYRIEQTGYIRFYMS